MKPRVFSSTSVPSIPDYTDKNNWAAHPAKDDPADRTPSPDFKNDQHAAQVDVFFLHPTSLTKRPRLWNADVADAKINQNTDRAGILYQASIFNAAGRVFAPRYRQAHLRTFFTKDKASADAALDLAYEDVRAAFQFFLENESTNRPILLVGHSQGALHGKRLMQEFFDGKPLQRRLVAAYLVGWPVFKGDFAKIPPCETPDQTGCVCSWRTFKHGFLPKGVTLGDSIIVTNPITWTTGPALAPKELNPGSVLRDFDKIYPEIADAQVCNGILWAHKPKFPGSALLIRRNYHVADLNFYYCNIRENALRRVGAFWK